MVKSEVPEEVFQTAKNLHQETSVLVTGEIREDSRSKFGYEIGITNVEVVSESCRFLAVWKTSSGTSLFTTTPWKKAVPSLNCKNAIFPLDRLFATQAPIVI